MMALWVTLKLQTPVLITGLSNGEENSSQSLSFIPGSALRGALISRYAKSASDLPVDPQAKKLFFSGEVRFLNAYPVDRSGNRMLPLPASWRVEKGQDLETADVVDLALAADPNKDVTIRKPFRGINPDQSIYAHKPVDELSVHIASQGRGIVNGDSTVFQYQALARDQRFQAMILADDENDLTRIEELLTANILYLGRSRSAGYGKVLIESVERKKAAETKTVSSPVTTITLLSDVILRDQNGQPTHDLDGYFSRHFGRLIRNKAAFLKTSEVGGFNRKWRLPLPQMPALGMGSVFVYAADVLSLADLEELQKAGIGERLVDGYGRIAVNLAEAGNLRLTRETATEPGSPDPQLSSESQALARSMSERLLRHTLEQNLVTEVNRYSIKGSITNHQLARMRTVFRQALDDPQKDEEIGAFFAGLKSTAKEQLHNTRLHAEGKLAGTRLDMWLEERLKKQDGLPILNITANNVPAIAGLRSPLSDALKREYTLRLVEAVVDRAMKLNNGKEA